MELEVAGEGTDLHLACLNLLPTMKVMFGRRVTETYQFSICQEVVENGFKVVVHCLGTVEVWKIMKANDFKLPKANEAMKFWEWWAKAVETKERS